MQHVIADYMELNHMRHEHFISHDTLFSLNQDETYIEVMQELEKVVSRLHRNTYYQLKRTYSKDAGGIADQYIKGILVKPVETGYHIAIKRLSTLLKGSTDTSYARDCLQSLLESTYICEYIEKRRQEHDGIYTKHDLARQTNERLDRMIEFQLVLQNLYEIYTDIENEDIIKILHKQQRIFLNESSNTHVFKKTVDEIRDFLGGLCLK